MRGLIVAAAGALMVTAGLVLFDWRLGLIFVGALVLWLGLVADFGGEG